jgi:hypothetical protein
MLTPDEEDLRETWSEKQLLRHILIQLELLNEKMDQTLILKVPKSVEVKIV